MGPRPTLTQQQGHHVGPLLVLGPLGGFFKSCLMDMTVYETPGTQWVGSLPWRNLRDTMIPHRDLRDPFAFCGFWSQD